jgi:hypothetical protein
MTVRDASADDLRRAIDSARAHAETQRAEAHRLRAELPQLNERLGAARFREEHLQRPSTLVTETAPLWIDRRHARLRARLRERFTRR